MVGVIGAILGAAGHRIVAAYDGREALRRFDEEAPDLVLLDLSMPGTDGATSAGPSARRATRRSSSSPERPTWRSPSSSSTPAPTTTSASRSAARSSSPAPGRSPDATAASRTGTAGRSTAGATKPLAGQPDRPDRDRAAPPRATHRAARRGRRRGDLLAYAWPGVADPDPLWLKPHLARLRTKLVAAGAPVPVAVRGVGYRLDDGAVRDGGTRRIRAVTDRAPAVTAAPRPVTRSASKRRTEPPSLAPSGTSPAPARRPSSAGRPSGARIER